MSPFLDLPENSLQANGSDISRRLAQVGFPMEGVVFTITWSEVAEELAEILIGAGIDNERFDEDLLTKLVQEVQKALNDDAVLSWREIVNQKIVSMPEIEPFLPMRDIEDDEGPLTEAYENATRLGDEDYYWVDGGASANFVEDF